MRRFKTSAAAVAWIFLLLSMSACSDFEFLKPPPLETAFNPLPPPPAPPNPPQPEGPPAPEAARVQIYRWFMTHGYKDFQAEALMEHTHAESGYRACANGGPYTISSNGAACGSNNCRDLPAIRAVRKSIRSWRSTTRNCATTLNSRAFGARQTNPPPIPRYAAALAAGVARPWPHSGYRAARDDCELGVDIAASGESLFTLPLLSRHFE